MDTYVEQALARRKHYRLMAASANAHFPAKLGKWARARTTILKFFCFHYQIQLSFYPYISRSESGTPYREGVGKAKFWESAC